MTKDVMMRKVLIISGLIFFSYLSVFGQTSSNINGGTSITSEYVDGDILIKFKSIPDQRQAVELVRNQLISRYNSTVEKQWRTGAEHWKVDTLLQNYDLLQIIDSLNSNPFIEYAEPNYILRADVIPNDPSYGDQWALNNTGQNGGTPDADIDAPEAWDITTGDTNIVVGVLDSGIDYNHPDLADNIWTNWDEIPNNGIDDDNNGYIDDIHGWDFYNNDNDPMDDYGHGTHVAGTIGAVSNNSIGVTGVAWDVRMIALKFLGSDGSGPTSGAVSAVEYATVNGVKLTNNSWGGGEYLQTLYNAIAESDTSGVLFIASAGNDTRDNDNIPNYPANYDLPNIVSVASTDRNDSISTFSNWGLNTVDIAAPGTAIYSTLPNNTYGTLNGTSMAAPHVSGGVVFAWSQFPGFSSHQIKQQILGGSDYIQNFDSLINSGSRLNIYNSVIDTNMSIEVNTREMDLGALILGNQSTEKRIIITNIMGDLIIIDSVVCETGFLVSRNTGYSNFISSFSVGPNQNDTISVVFDPTITGSFNKKCKLYYKTSGMIARTVTILLSGYCAANGTIINAGTVSGIWEKALSPYIINGNISVEASNTLVIEPGVNVQFADYYSVVVSDNSILIANGSESDSIYFYAIDTIIGWAGIDLVSKQYVDSLTYCLFKNGKAHSSIDQSWPANYHGGVISITNSSPTIADCSFKYNNAEVGHGGAIYVYGNSYPTLTRLEFLNNSAPYGGALSISGTASDETYRLLNNSVFINNTAVYGGALYNQQGNLIVRNSTFYNNDAYYGGGAINLWTDSDVIIKNSILFENTSPDGNQIKFGSYMVPSSLFIEYCSIDTSVSDWYTHSSNYSALDVFQMGEGNIYSQPDFVDQSINNLALSASSPCIDAGNPNDDVGEETFPNGYRVNMGFQGGTKDAAVTTNPGLATIPNPLDYETLSPNETKQLPLYLKNGCPVTIHINDISLSDNSKFSISTSHTTSSILSSGQIDSVMIDFSSDIILDSLYQISINISTNETADYSIPAQANILFGTNVDSAIVSGNWMLVNSPYNINNDINIATNDSLLIEPGVRIRFMGKYSMYIGPTSKIKAIGTESLPIYFTAYDTVTGWYGIDFVNSGYDDVFEHCNFSRGIADGVFPNDRGGAMYMDNSSPIVNYSTIENNRGNTGAAIFLNSSNAYFTEVNISNNNSSGEGVVYIDNSTDVIFENCIINDNYSGLTGGGFMIWNNSILSLKNCLINNNFGSSGGGGISVAESIVNLTNVTLANNSAYGDGHEILLIQDAQVNTFNSIIYNNLGSENFADIQFQAFGTTQNLLNISHSNIDTLKSNWVAYGLEENAVITWGDGNMTSYPQFKDTNNRIFTLDLTSPCIDAGDSTSSTTNFDLEGNPRILLNTIDMGAYEFGNYWTGTENSNWFDPLNWKNNTAPDSTSILTVPDATFYINTPSIQSDQKVKKLFLKENAVLEINNGGSLEVVGDQN